MGDVIRLTGGNRNTLKQHFRALVEQGHLDQHGAGRDVWYELRYGKSIVLPDVNLPLANSPLTSAYRPKPTVRSNVMGLSLHVRFPKRRTHPNAEDF